jgi:hypothetical protein
VIKLTKAYFADEATVYPNKQAMMNVQTEAD